MTNVLVMLESKGGMIGSLEFLFTCQEGLGGFGKVVSGGVDSGCGEVLGACWNTPVDLAVVS